MTTTNQEIKHFALPDLGEGLVEADIIAWHVAPGDQVRINQVIAEVETAKATVELPSPYAGTVLELHHSSGSTVAVGAPIITVELAGTAPPPKKIEVLVGYGPDTGRQNRRRPRRTVQPDTAPEKTNVLAAPPVRKLAKELGVDLATVRSANGRISRADVLAAATPTARPAGDERIPVRGIRKATAAAMARSAFTAPQATVYRDVDVTEALGLLDGLRALPDFAEVKLTPLVLVARAVLLALARHRTLNAQWAETEIVAFAEVNLGIAVAIPGGLVVPNLKRAGRLSFAELAVALTGLVSTARTGAATPTDLTGGTFTITNIGVFGVDSGSPIVNPGEAAILSVGEIHQRPWVLDGELAVRSVVTLGLSFDHRIVDGEQGARFLAEVAGILADPVRYVAMS